MTINAGEPVERAAYSIDEVAEALGISRPMVYKLVAEGRLRFVPAGARRLIPAAALEELLAG